MGTVNRLATAILFMAITGIGISSTWTPVVALTTKWFSASKRGFILGVITSGSFLGYGVLGLVFPLVMVRYDWRFGWTILGLSALIVTVVNGLVLRSKPEDLGIIPWEKKENLPSLHFMSLMTI